MIHTKQFEIDNLEGAKYLIISATPQTDFFKTITQVRITNYDQSSISTLLDEFLSPKQIVVFNQANPFSFIVPIRSTKMLVDVTIMSDSNGVDDFFIEKGNE